MKTCTTKIDLRPSIYLTTQLKKERDCQSFANKKTCGTCVFLRISAI